MKKLNLAAVIVCALVGQSFGNPLNLQFSLYRKRFGVERSETLSTKSTSAEWGFTVQVENRTFQVQQGLEFRYRLYYVDDQRQAKSTDLPLKFKEGKFEMAELKNGEKAKFDTETVKLDQSELKANWQYMDRGREKTRDGLKGIWIKVFKEGVQVAEHVSPASLKQGEAW